MPESSRIQYSFTGLKNLTLTENLPFELQGNQYIETIQLNDNLTKIVVDLKSGVNYTDKKTDIDFFVKQLFFNLIIKTDAEITCPDWQAECVFENGKARISERIVFQDHIAVFRSCNAKEIYDVIVNAPTAMDKHPILYDRIFGILQNKNQIIQFMSLYQILFDKINILAGKKHTNDYVQKSVTNYLGKNKEKYPFVSFYPSRKEGMGKNEDTFTHIRNEIGHCEETDDLSLYSKIGSQVTPCLIKNLLVVLNDVIMLL